MKKILLLLSLSLFITVNVFGQTSSNKTETNCDFLEKETDQFTGEITINYNATKDVSFIKIIKNGIASFYLSIYIKESGVYMGKGANIILCTADTVNNVWINSFKINKPNQVVDCSVIGGNFYTNSFIKLTKNDLELLKKGEHMKYKLYISNDECHYDSYKIKCLINSK